MGLDRYVTFGRSGLLVTPLCLGTMTFGEENGLGVAPADAKLLLDRYIERGGNFIDTANIYSNGHAEKIIGDEVGRISSKRGRLVIATKFSGNLHYGDPNGGGASRKSILAACEQSLRRLQTDYIDVYWQHWADPFAPLEETLRALDDLVRSGKVRYIGFSDTPAWKSTEAHVTAAFRGWAPLVALQFEYSLVERTVEAELIPMARGLGLGVAAWSPLGMGALTGKFTRTSRSNDSLRGEIIAHRVTEAGYTIIDRLVEVARKYDTSPARVALAWLHGRPGVSSIIIGARKLTQLDDNLAALDLTLAAEDIDALTQVSQPRLAFPANLRPMFEGFTYGGFTVNGQAFGPAPHTPTEDMKVY